MTNYVLPLSSSLVSPPLIPPPPSGACVRGAAMSLKFPLESHHHQTPLGRSSRFLNLWGNGTSAANTQTESTFDSGMTVGQLSLGSERLLYTYINNTALLTAAALLVVGFIVVAVGLFLYDRLVLGNSDYANNKQDDNYYYGSSAPSATFLVAPSADPYGSHGISRIRR
jgi:hypothetical protein